MQSKELIIGRAGEYLVLSDLLLKGHQCFDSGQGVNYDIVMEKGSKLLKIQVKTTKEKKMWLSKTHDKTTPSYFFHIKRCGKHGNKSYKESDFDLFALVMLDIRQVAYLVNKSFFSLTICKV